MFKMRFPDEIQMRFHIDLTYLRIDSDHINMKLHVQDAISPRNRIF